MKKLLHTFTVWVILFTTPILLAAPAPFNRRASCVTTPPRFCIMYWGNTQYITRFSADGSYEAKEISTYQTTYHGRWQRDGTTLWIVESTTPHWFDSYIHYQINMSNSRNGVIFKSGTIIRLEDK